MDLSRDSIDLLHPFLSGDFRKDLKASVQRKPRRQQRGEFGREGHQIPLASLETDLRPETVFRGRLDLQGITPVFLSRSIAAF